MNISVTPNLNNLPDDILSIIVYWSEPALELFALLFAIYVLFSFMRSLLHY